MGKTTFALALAREMGYALACKDDVRDIAATHDAKTNAEIAARHPGSTMRVDSNEMTYEIMFAVGLTQLRVGAPGVVFESPLGRVRLGERVVAITKDCVEQKPFYILVDCVAERSVWEARLAERKNVSHRPHDADQIMRNYENIHYDLKHCDSHIIVDCGCSPESQVQKVRKVIEELRFDEKTR